MLTSRVEIEASMKKLPDPVLEDSLNSSEPVGAMAKALRVLLDPHPKKKRKPSRKRLSPPAKPGS
jgi:hypothetical protein